MKCCILLTVSLLLCACLMLVCHVAIFHILVVVSSSVKVESCSQLLYDVIIIIICRLIMCSVGVYNRIWGMDRWEVGSCLRMVRKTEQVCFELVFESLHSWSISYGGWDSLENSLLRKLSHRFLWKWYKFYATTPSNGHWTVLAQWWTYLSCLHLIS